MRSLLPPDILWIHWRVYNFIANTSKWILFLPPSDAYVRSFLYLLYTLIKLYYTKALSDQASSLAPDWILLLRGPRIPVSSRDSTTTFQYHRFNEDKLGQTPEDGEGQRTWHTAVHRVAKSQTRLGNWTTIVSLYQHNYIYILQIKEYEWIKLHSCTFAVVYKKLIWWQ